MTSLEMESVMTTEERMQELFDRQDIYEIITRYCRGVDRGNVELIQSCYFDDAQDDHGMFKGLGVEFAQWITDWCDEHLRCSQHFIGNFQCEIDGDIAHTETYCISCSETKTDTQSTVYNRYIDRFERRGGEWRIANRLVVLDVSRNDPVTANFDDGNPDWNFTWGRRDGAVSLTQPCLT